MLTLVTFGLPPATLRAMCHCPPPPCCIFLVILLFYTVHPVAKSPFHDGGRAGRVRFVRAAADPLSGVTRKVRVAGVANTIRDRYVSG